MTNLDQLRDQAATKLHHLIYEMVDYHDASATRPLALTVIDALADYAVACATQPNPLDPKQPTP